MKVKVVEASNRSGLETELNKFIGVSTKVHYITQSEIMVRENRHITVTVLYD